MIPFNNTNPAGPTITNVPAIEPPQDELSPVIIPFAEAHLQLGRLLTQNTSVVDNRNVNRKLRTLDPVLLELPHNVTGDDAGKLSGSDVQITVHQIHKLMSRKFPDLYQFLVKPSRVAVFMPTIEGTCDTPERTVLEKWLTGIYRYSGWKTPFNRCIDGALLHGHAAVEQVYSPDVPGNVKYNYVAYGDVIFQEGAIDIEHSDYVMVRKHLTHKQIDEMKELPGANVAEITKLYRRAVDRTQIEEVYRVYCKHKDPISNTVLVYGFWYGKASGDYLVSPAPLYCGEVELREQEPIAQTDPFTGMPLLDTFGMPVRIPQPPTIEFVIETEYPVSIYAPYTTEEDRIDSSRGQAFWTRSNQKAMCAMASGTVTKAIQAAGVYAAVDVQNTPPGTKPEAISPVTRNTIYSVPIRFTSPDGPDASAIPILQYFDSQISDENGQTAYTVANRKDSRKTKTELDIAEEQQDLNKSGLIDNLAEWLTKTITRTYRIAASRAKAGVPNYPAPQEIIPLLDIQFNIFPAGYTDLLERQQLVSNLERYLPVAVQAGIGPQYSARLMQLVFPQEPFAKQIIQQSQQAQLVPVLQAAYEFIKSTTTSDELNALQPQQLQQFQQLLGTMEQAITAGSQQVGAQSGQPGPDQGTNSSPGQPSQGSGNPGMQ